VSRETAERATDLADELREYRGLVGFSLAYLAAFVVYGAARGNAATVVYAVAVAGAFAFVAVVHVRVGFSAGVLWALSTWGLLHMAGGLVTLDGRVLYSVQLLPVVLRYDQAVHAFGFGAATVAAWQALRGWLVPGRPMSTGLALLVALTGMGIGALNEVLEFFATRLSEATNVGGYANTGWDLVFNMLGAAGATLLLLRAQRGAPVPHDR
jgi:hypothetical protein